MSEPVPAGFRPALENPSLIPQGGHLYVVATPIGNLADLTDRARAILSAVDLIACEDTRTTGALLTRLGLRRELVAYHEHNETEAAERLADLPGGGRRTIRRPLGVHGVFCNGVMTFDGKDYVKHARGPGQVLDRFNASQGRHTRALAAQ